MNSDIQYRSPEEITKCQQAKLQEALAYLQARSPFYRSLFAKEHITVGKIKTIEDLRLLPTTSKADLQSRNKDFMCVPPSLHHLHFRLSVRFS